MKWILLCVSVLFASDALGTLSSSVTGGATSVNIVQVSPGLYDVSITKTSADAPNNSDVYGRCQRRHSDDERFKQLTAVSLS